MLGVELLLVGMENTFDVLPIKKVRNVQSTLVDRLTFNRITAIVQVSFMLVFPQVSVLPLKL